MVHLKVQPVAMNVIKGEGGGGDGGGPVEAVRRGEESKFLLESKRETDKVEAFADDTSVVTKACQHSIRALKEVLLDFGALSGLKCNMEKSVLMPIGGANPLDINIVNTGFLVRNSITVLGFQINGDLSDMENCHEKAIAQMRSIARFWDRLNLSLPGRINIAKALLLPQINYLGSITQATKEQLNMMQNIFDNFIIGKLSVGKDRRYLDPGKGGLGIFLLSEFLESQQALWVKKAHMSKRDNWRNDISNFFHGNCLVATPEKINRLNNPILHTIADSYQKFNKIFNNTDQNFDNSFLLNNPVLKRGVRDNGKIDINFFSQNIPNIDSATLARIKISDICVNGILKSLDEINMLANIPFSLATYMRLGEAIRTHKRVEIGLNLGKVHSSTMHDFLVRFKKGSKPLRRVFTKYRQLKINPGNHRIVKTYFRLLEIPQIEDDNLKRLLSIWNMNAMQNKFREFCFKFTNNQLGLNSRVAHFVGNHDPGCTFCTFGGLRPVPLETFSHLFYDCVYTSRTLDGIKNILFPDLQFANDTQKKNFWFCGVVPTIGDNSNLFILIAVLCILYLVWETKLKKNTLAVGKICNEFFYIITRMLKCNSRLEYDKNTLNLVISREWNEIRGRHG